MWITPPVRKGESVPANVRIVRASVPVFKEAYVDGERKMIRAAQKRYFGQEVQRLRDSKEKEVFRSGPL